MRVGLVAVYFVGLLIAEALRWPQRVRRVRSQTMRHVRDRRSRGPEFVVLFWIVLGMWVLPGAYAFTPVLRSFDYLLPSWVSWIGVGVFAAGLVVRWRAHQALGAEWSPTLETSREHTLITHGIYASIQHPIYAAMVLWAVAQPILLQNALAGPAGLVAVGLLWLIRVPREEAMMRERFGDGYRQYAARTGRMLPALHRSPPSSSER